MVSSPVFSGANKHRVLNKVGVLGNKAPEFNSLIAQLIKTTESGDTGESALLIQAITLDKMFNHMVQLAFGTEGTHTTEHFDLWLKFALRAQSQCRATYEAVSAIRHPRIQYVSEQYNANNMQVNNAPTPEKNRNPQNELTEGLRDDLLNDTKAKAGSCNQNTQESAVAKINRAA